MRLLAEFRSGDDDNLILALGDVGFVDDLSRLVDLKFDAFEKP